MQVGKPPRTSSVPTANTPLGLYGPEWSPVESHGTGTLPFPDRAGNSPSVRETAPYPIVRRRTPAVCHAHRVAREGAGGVAFARASARAAAVRCNSPPARRAAI